MEKYWCLFACCLLLINLVNADEAAESSEIEGRTGSITLNGNNQWWAGAVYIIPILIIIVILDFAIFGTFASRADELNPVSRFFFHARNGLHLIRNKKRRQYQNLYHHHRHQRSCWHVKKNVEKPLAFEWLWYTYAAFCFFLHVFTLPKNHQARFLHIFYDFFAFFFARLVVQSRILRHLCNTEISQVFTTLKFPCKNVMPKK